ncbi:hypothetical protein BaRGS_00018388 [Batillaria attramentaria]|uniref:Secreted protein n=1 Tax=Batillaria attramentaria TaxID=370345 RepID=A0ABD0KT97_9CAEN
MQANNTPKKLFLRALLFLRFGVGLQPYLSKTTGKRLFYVFRRSIRSRRRDAGKFHCCLYDLLLVNFNKSRSIVDRKRTATRIDANDRPPCARAFTSQTNTHIE